MNAIWTTTFLELSKQIVRGCRKILHPHKQSQSSQAFFSHLHLRLLHLLFLPIATRTAGVHRNSSQHSACWIRPYSRVAILHSTFPLQTKISNRTTQSRDDVNLAVLSSSLGPSTRCNCTTRLGMTTTEENSSFRL